MIKSTFCLGHLHFTEDRKEKRTKHLIDSGGEIYVDRIVITCAGVWLGH